MKLRTLAVAGATIIALAGCSSGGGDSDAEPAAAPSADDRQQTLTEAAKCARENGRPDWPDPQLDDNGEWAFPEDVLDTRPPAACDDLFRSAKGAAPPSRAPLSAADMDQLRKWAECIRSHNIPNWPDPDSEGVFIPPSDMHPLENNSAWRGARTACKSQEPPNGARVRLPPGMATKPAR
ncbi:hypothetical protein ACFP2T_05465 [Plantactinospora solaniradicis]|uniref:Uncharacterized protein n=1 Tax=Plantactinospora solaniradicis TaxID=1723736 RepID=A0ABW1K3U8_9ACTN